MNNKHLTDILKSLTEKEIPDDMDLWPVIQEQLQHPPRRRMRRFQRLIVIAAVLGTLLISAAAYGFYQQQTGPDDPGLDEVKHSNLITPLGLSQTINGFTVTLDWAYADAHRIAIAYTLGSEASTDMYGIFPMEHLTDDQGNLFPSTFGGVVSDNNLQKANANFDASSLSGAPDSLKLTLTVDIQRQTNLPPLPTPDPNVTPDGSGGGFGGGGGGSGEGFVPYIPEDASSFQVGNIPMGEAVEFETQATLSFEFTIPFIPAVVVEPGETITTHDLAVTLEKIAVAPSMTKAVVCHPLPDEQSWSPFVRLNTGSIQLEAATSTPLGDGCWEITFLAPYDRQPATWTFTVERLQTPPVFTADQLEAAFAEYGVTVEVQGEGSQGGYSFSGSSQTIPEGIDINQLWRQVEDRFRQITSGPWEFTIEIP